MGTSSSTCALTHTVIEGGDEILLVHTLPTQGRAAPPAYAADTYHFSVAMLRYRRETQDEDSMVTRLQAIAARLGDAELAAGAAALTPQLEYRAVFGRHDDYGWIEVRGEKYDSGLPNWRTKDHERLAVLRAEPEDAPPPPTPHGGYQLSRKDEIAMLEEMQRQDLRLDPQHFFMVRCSALRRLFPGVPLTGDGAEIMTALAEFAHVARCELFGVSGRLLGTSERDELEAQRRLLQCVQDELDDFEARLGSQDAEDDWDEDDAE